ncbi:MAG: phBC6A51 family helix-turn-helix protein [Candidatus Acidiferrales bacterium]
MSEETPIQADARQQDTAGNVRNSPVKSRVKTAFIEWLALPEALRVPSTARQFAAENAVSERTLFRWRRQSQVSAEVQELASLHARSRFGEVAHAIVERAIAGDVSAQKLYLQSFVPATGLENKREIIVQFGDETELVPFFALKENQQTKP